MEQRSTRDAYGETLKNIGSNPDIVVLDADLSISTKTNLFARKYPERFFDVGCAEQNLFGVSSGFAIAGKTVFASTYAIFASRALEQIRNTIAHDSLNVKIVVTHAGLTNSVDGASHQSLEDIATMRAIPNMRVIIPADALETEQVIKAELTEPGPAYIRLNRSESPVIFGIDYQYDMNTAEIIRDGADIAIFATGTMVYPALEAARILEEDSIDTCVIDVHTIKPLDTTTISRIALQCGGGITVEEHSVIGGLGSAIAECTSQHYPIPLRLIGVNDRFGQSGDYQALLDLYGLTTNNLVKNVQEILKVKK
jgi:transketolase